MTTPETLSALAGGLLSLVFSYVPGVSAWFAGLDGVHKRLLMLACLLVVTLGAFGLACAGLGEDLELSLACTRSGAVTLARCFVLALSANQSAFLITPKS